MSEAQKIIKEINKLGATCYRIAKETGLNESTVSRIRIGVHKDPKPETLIKLKELRDKLRKK